MSIEGKGKYDIRANFDEPDNGDGYESNKPSNKKEKSETPVLDNFSRDLTKMAEEEKRKSIESVKF